MTSFHILSIMQVAIGGIGLGLTLRLLAMMAHHRGRWYHLVENSPRDIYLTYWTHINMALIFTGSMVQVRFDTDDLPKILFVGWFVLTVSCAYWEYIVIKRWFGEIKNGLS